ncbi:MAG: presenilin family intramembrane aspartyl protease [Nanoarchaeota archaeon]
MKHTWKITFILLTMFLATQFIGLIVINAYSPTQKIIINQSTGQEEIVNVHEPLPYGMEPPQTEQKLNLISIIISFTIAISLVLIFIKYKFKFIIKAWFFIVVALALAISLNALLMSAFPNLKFAQFNYASSQISYLALSMLVLSIIISFLKVYRPNFILHNLTELFIYPGIAAVFVPILNVVSIIFLLILISIYDMWAVWHSGIMQKMAKFQIEELKVLGGFLVPYIPANLKKKLKKMKKSELKNKKIKISLAILGGGDIVFPIITAGVFLRNSSFGLIPALFVIFGAFCGLLFLFLRSEKKKFYPAMPFITIGIFAGIILSFLVKLISLSFFMLV